MKKLNLCVLFLIIGLFLSFQTISAHTKVFNYQSKLTEGGAAANGIYDFKFRLFNSELSGMQIATGTAADKQWQYFNKNSDGITATVN